MPEPETYIALRYPNGSLAGIDKGSGYPWQAPTLAFAWILQDSPSSRKTMRDFMQVCARDDFTLVQFTAALTPVITE